MQKLVPHNAVLIPDDADRVFAGILYDVYHWPQKLFDGRHSTYELLHRQDTALVIGIDGDKVIIVSDDQPHRGVRVGFPGGRIDSTDKSTLSAAQREMREETGLTFRNWRLIEVVQPATKMEYFIYAYVAWGVDQRLETDLDAGEELIRIDHVDFDTMLKRVEGQELTEAVELLRQAGSIEGIINLPNYNGKLVDRAVKANIP